MRQTILLTDVEGSTRLWREEPTRIRRHDERVPGVVAAHARTLLMERGEGDSVFATFDKASGALAAARDLQMRFLPSLRVRVALHIGELEGLDVNRCARLRSLAHGGQVLVTLAAVAALDALPDGVTLADLGFHPLRDFERPERVFQLCHADLPQAFPPLTPPESVAHVAELADLVRKQISMLGDGAPTLGLSALIGLRGDAQRAEFLRDLQQLFEPLADKYPLTPDGSRFQLALVCYPTAEEG